MISFKKLFLIALVSGCALQTTASESSFNTDIVPSGLAQNAFIAVTVAGLSYAAYASYNCIKNYLDKTITEHIADHIVVALTPNSVTKSMSEEQKKEFYHKKARLINVRKRILDKLQAIDLTTLSKEHAKQVQSKIKLMKRLFLLIDTLRAENPYEKLYTTASYVDQYIENYIIEKLIFAVKPEAECTRSELQKKLQSKQKTKQFISLVSPRISDTYFILLLEQILNYR